MALQQKGYRWWRWTVHLEPGHGKWLPSCTVTLPNVTHVSLVDPASAIGQGSVNAYARMGETDILLATLSTERPRVELEPRVFLIQESEFALYVTQERHDSDADADDYTDSDCDTDSDTDSDGDGDPIVVQFQGTVYCLPPPEMEKEEEEEESDATDTDDDEDATPEAPAFSGIFAFVYLVTFLLLVMYC
jgi:hypothetical protein